MNSLLWLLVPFILSLVIVYFMPEDKLGFESFAPNGYFKPLVTNDNSDTY